jgi:molybdopterin biosynthesis enzyme MoaB
MSILGRPNAVPPSNFSYAVTNFTMTELKLKAAVLIISDTAAEDISTDKTGPILLDVFKEAASEKWDVVQTDIVPDDILKIQRFIRRWTDSSDAINLIVTSGGTGDWSTACSLRRWLSHPSR